MTDLRAGPIEDADIDSIILSRREYEELTSVLQDARDEVAMLCNAIVDQGPIARQGILEYLRARSRCTPSVTRAETCRVLVAALEDLMRPEGGAA